MAVTDIIKALQKHDVEVGEHAIDKLVEEIHTVLMEKDSDLLESLEDYLGEIVKATKENLKTETKQMVKNVKGKKVKDPNAPKRPPSAYNLFVKDKMKELSEEHPEITRQNLMKMAVQDWHKSKGDHVEEENKFSGTKLLSDTEPEESETEQKPVKIEPKKAGKKKGGK